MTKKGIVFKKTTKRKLEQCKINEKETIAGVITRLVHTYGKELL